MNYEGKSGDSIKAVLFGTAVDIGSTWLIASLAASVIQAAAIADSSVSSPDDLRQFIAESHYLLLFFAVTGALCSFIGAYLAAKIAPSAPIMHALCVGLLGIIIPLAVFYEIPPKWVYSLSALLIISFSMLAGYLAGDSANQGPSKTQNDRPPAMPPPVPSIKKSGPPPIPPINGIIAD